MQLRMLLTNSRLVEKNFETDCWHTTDGPQGMSAIVTQRETQTPLPVSDLWQWKETGSYTLSETFLKRGSIKPCVPALSKTLHRTIMSRRK